MRTKKKPNSSAKKTKSAVTKKSSSGQKPRVLTIVGTRPELIKLAKVIEKLDLVCDHFFVHTGQNFDYELHEIFYTDLGIRKPDRFLNLVKESTMETIGAILCETDRLLDELKPDAVLIYGDTNSCLAGIAVKRKRIPLFHMEAGNRSFDQRVPEELNRKIIDHISDINFTNSQNARQYLLSEGKQGNTVIVSGSPMAEIIHASQKKINSSKVLSKLGLKSENYFVVSLHREENVDTLERLQEFCRFLKQLADRFNLPIVFSIHPRTQKRMDTAGIELKHPLILPMKPLGFSDYIHLQKEAKLTISDSGTITEESSILNFRAITPRAAHERPEGTEAGVLIKSPVTQASLMSSVEAALVLDPAHFVPDYEDRNVSDKVVKAVLSFIDQIKRTNWYQNSF